MCFSMKNKYIPHIFSFLFATFLCSPLVFASTSEQAPEDDELIVNLTKASVKVRLYSAERVYDGGVGLDEGGEAIESQVERFIVKGNVDDGKFKALSKEYLEKKLKDLTKNQGHRIVLDFFKWTLKDPSSLAEKSSTKMYQVRRGELNNRKNSNTKKKMEFQTDFENPLASWSNMDDYADDTVDDFIGAMDDDSQMDLELYVLDGEVAKVGAYLWHDVRDPSGTAVDEDGEEYDTYDAQKQMLGEVGEVYTVWTVREKGKKNELQLKDNQSLSKYMDDEKYQLYANVVIDRSWYNAFMEPLKMLPLLNREVPVFSYKDENGNKKTLYVKNGDIIVRLGESVQIAAGTLPMPAFDKDPNDKSVKTFEDDPILEDWAKSRFSLTYRIFRDDRNKLAKAGSLLLNGLFWLVDKVPLVPNLTEKFTLSDIKKYIDSQLEDEFGTPYTVPFEYEEGEDVPEVTKITKEKVKATFGRDFKNLVIGPSLVEGRPYNLLKNDIKNPFRISLLDDALRKNAALKKAAAYYPGTILLTHVSVIAIEENEDGFAEVVVYDAYPGGMRREKLDAQLASKYSRAGGIFRVVPDEGTDPNKDLALRAINNTRERYCTWKLRYEEDAAKKVYKFSDGTKLNCNRAWPTFTKKEVEEWRIYEDEAELLTKDILEVKELDDDGEGTRQALVVAMKKTDDIFGYDFSSGDQKKIHCSEEAWLAYLEEGVDLMTNYSTLTVPKVMAQKMGWAVDNMIQVAPQALMLSSKTIRIADFSTVEITEEETSLADAVMKASDKWVNPETEEVEILDWPIVVQPEVELARSRGKTIIKVFDHPPEKLQLVNPFSDVWPSEIEEEESEEGEEGDELGSTAKDAKDAA